MQLVCKKIFYLVIFLYVIGNPENLLAAPAPSTTECDYYTSLNHRLNCGAEAYLEKVGIPLCDFYKDKAKDMPLEIQEWFPKVRLCLQAELQKNDKILTCQNLNQIAKKTHLDCYKATGFCELAFTSKARLSLLTSLRLPYTWWGQMGLVAYHACFDLE